MDFIHEFKVIQLTKRSQVGPLQNVIVDCKWRMTTYHKDHPDITQISDATTPFTIDLQNLPNNFIDFNDLNEEDVISWVKESGKPAILNFKSAHKIKILNEIASHVDEIVNPWREIPGPNIVQE